MSAPPHFEVHAGYATFRPAGPTTVPEYLSLIRLAMETCRANGVTRLLVDARRLSHPPLTTTDRFDMAAELSSFWDRRIRLAVLNRPDQMDPARFGLLVAENRAMRYSVHTSEAEALRHLLAAGDAAPRGDRRTRRRSKVADNRVL